MNRTLIAVAAIALAALPLVSAAQSMPSALHESMGTAQHDGLMLGPLPASLQGKPVVVRIHADWCPACKATQATYESVRVRYSDQATFVTFDVTDAKTAAAAATEAKKLGLGKLFDAKKTATSTVAVINPKTGVVSASLYNENAPGAYAKAIDAVRSQLQPG